MTDNDDHQDVADLQPEDKMGFAVPKTPTHSLMLLNGVVTLSFSGRKGQGLVDIQAKQAAIFHASKASRRW